MSMFTDDEFIKTYWKSKKINEMLDFNVTQSYLLISKYKINKKKSIDYYRKIKL